MKIACLMMQKNERRLLPVWVEYHGKMFGYENLYVFDNGSTDAENLEYLSKLPGLGVNLVSEFKEKIDFERKADIFKSLIDSLDDSCAYDFYFPLDCDEFVAIEVDGRVSVDREDIVRGLAEHLGEQKVLRISAAYDNLPIDAGVYFKSAGQKKCFFAARTYLSSDIGFHDSCTRSGYDSIKTKIAYIHMHNRVYDDYCFYAAQKLIGRIADFSPESLRRHIEIRGAGFHLALPLLLGSHFYYLHMLSRRLKWPGSHVRIDGFSGFSDAIGFCDAGSLYYEVDSGLSACVDSVRKFGGRFELNGWAFHGFNSVGLIFHVGIGPDLLGLHSITLVPREDVRSIHSGAPLRCGFQIIVDSPPYDGDGDDCWLFVSSDPKKIGRPLSLKKWVSVIRDS